MTRKYSPKLYKSPQSSFINSKTSMSSPRSDEQSESEYSRNHSEPHQSIKSENYHKNINNKSPEETSSDGSEYNMSGMTKLLEMYLEIVKDNEDNYEKILHKIEKVSHKLDSLNKDQISKREKLVQLKTQLIKEQSTLKHKTKDLLENIAHATYTASQEL